MLDREFSIGTKIDIKGSRCPTSSIFKVPNNKLRISSKRSYQVVVDSTISGVLDDDFIVDKRGDRPTLKSKVCFEVVDEFPQNSFNSARDDARLLLFSECLAVP